MPIAQTLIPEFDEEMATTRRALERVPHGKAAVWTKAKRDVYRNVLNHLVHHRGQLTVYLRMNDVPVPAIYGPSADEQGFRA